MSWGVLVAALVVAVALVASSGAARRTGIPYPVFLVVAGLVISTLPAVHIPSLEPKVVFYGFLPPLVYSAAFLASPGEFAANWSAIGLLAVVLVLATTVAVAAVAHTAVTGLGWAPAFVLGAVVAPTDPVAAGEVIRRVGAPQQITTILEGESLINDGIALALYGLAVSAAGASSFSLLGGVAELGREVGISLAVGLAVGWTARVLRNRAGSGDVQVVFSLVTPYVAYLVADRLGASGVLATVTTGLYVGWRTEGLVPAPARLRTMTFWEVLDYLLNAILFLLLGARFASVVDVVRNYHPLHLALEAVAAVATVVALRLAWVLVVPRLTTGIQLLARREASTAPLRERLLIGWSGMRGAVSLAAALSIPLTVDHHHFPGRAEIVLITFCVILATLVVQGATLPLVIRRLGLAGAGGDRRSEALARDHLATAALARLDEIAEREQCSPGDLAPLRQLYEWRLQRAEAELEEEDEEEHAAGRDGSDPQGRRELLDRVWREVIQAARGELHRMEREGDVDNDLMLRLQRELDLEEVRRHR